jgi:predicted secreted hydrolase
VLGNALPFILAGLISAVLVSAPATQTAREWAEARPGRQIVLPDDHRSHPEYRLEWWYYTGNLFDDENRRFGYQLTFFRFGLNVVPAVASAWAVRDVYMAHLALTDVESARHHVAERLNRAAVGWAGADDRTYRVWNDDWRAGLEEGRHRLTAAAQDFRIDLTVDDGKSPALHGVDGYSRKGSSPGNASYYYSLTRMPTRGVVAVGTREFAVRGLSWMDHEFGTTFLERTQAGWDWFSLQLDDATELMVFRLRDRHGRADPRSSGTLVQRNGGTRALESSAFSLEPGRTWRSPATKAVYPVEWRIRLPGEGVDLQVRAAVDGQELSGLASQLAYWEGSIDVAGTRKGAPLRGRGYLEMTGYAGRAMGDLIGKWGRDKFQNLQRGPMIK